MAKNKYKHFNPEEHNINVKSVKRYIQEQEGKKPIDYDIYECPDELRGQLKIGDFYG